MHVLRCAFRFVSWRGGTALKIHVYFRHITHNTLCNCIQYIEHDCSTRLTIIHQCLIRCRLSKLKSCSTALPFSTIRTCVHCVGRPLLRNSFTIFNKIHNLFNCHCSLMLLCATVNKTSKIIQPLHFILVGAFLMIQG